MRALFQTIKHDLYMLRFVDSPNKSDLYMFLMILLGMIVFPAVLIVLAAYLPFPVSSSLIREAASEVRNISNTFHTLSYIVLLLWSLFTLLPFRVIAVAVAGFIRFMLGALLVSVGVEIGIVFEEWGIAVFWHSCKSNIQFLLLIFYIFCFSLALWCIAFLFDSKKYVAWVFNWALSTRIVALGLLFLVHCSYYISITF